MRIKVIGITLLLLTICSTANRLFAQTGTELFEKTREAYYKNDLFGAVGYGEKAAARLKADSGENNITYAVLLDYLASTYIGFQNFKKADSLTAKSVRIITQIKGTMSMEYASVIQNYANMAYLTRDFDKAERIYNEAADVVTRLKGQNDSNYAIIINNLSSIHYANQEYNKAITLITKAYEIYTNYYPGHTSENFVMVNNLGELYSSIGSYKKSLAYFSQANKLFATGELPANDESYTKLLNNFGVLYMRTKEYEKAESYFRMAMANQLKYWGKANEGYITPLNNLGMLQFQQYKLNECAASYQEVLNLWRSATVYQSANYAATLNNLAMVYHQKGDFSIADSLYAVALKTITTPEGNNVMLLSRLLLNQGLLKQAMGMPVQAFNLYKIADSININYVTQNFYGFAAQDKLNIISSMQFMFQAIPSYMQLQSASNTPEAAEEILHVQMVLKNLVLRDQQSLLQAVRSTQDTLTIGLFTRWKKNKSMLVRQYAQQQNKRSHYTDSLEKATDDMEQLLSQKSPAFLQHRQYFALSAKDISRKLQPRETAVEFFRYALFNGKWTDTICYAALVINAGDTTPKYVRLCTEAELVKLLRPASCAARDGDRLIMELYQPLLKNTGVSKGKLVYNKIWKPLLPYLQHAKTVYLSPAGLLYQVAFQAIPAGKEQMLGDRYSFRYVLSTGDIALKDLNTETGVRQVSLWANMQYSRAETPGYASSGKAGGTAADNVYFDYTKGSKSDCDTTHNWPALRFAQNEVKGITSLCKSSNVGVSVYQDAAATEEKLKTIHFNIPSVLHISTHGFFIRDTLKNSMRDFIEWQAGLSGASDPLFKSGIVLSGANAAWQGKQMTDSEDGIVTAYEIAQMDLSNTPLVILDACESALGSVYGSEGVFGLQRAFKIAGADKIMMSLWKVPEKETNELMINFYRQWLSGKPVHKALQEAQSIMRKQHLPPYYWAGFILAE